MIQRIQTIYLLLSALFTGSVFVFPFATGSHPEGVFADGTFNYLDNTGLMIGCIAVAALTLFNIFLFNNRKLQLSIGRAMMLGLVGLLGGIAFFLFGSGASFSVGIGLFTPIIALILLFFAQKGIQADEDLVRSADRIR